MFLATTSLREYWNCSKKVLFLGEWCKDYAKGFKDLESGSELLTYHWDNRDRLYSDYIYINNLYDKTIPYLTRFLNGYHDLHESELYWEVIVGPWYQYTLGIMYDRYLSLSEASKYADELETIITEEYFTSYTSATFQSESFRDEFNFILYSQLIKHCFGEIKYEVTNKNLYNEIPVLPKLQKRGFFKRLLSFLISSVGEISKRFNSIEVHNSYLPLKDELLLCLNFFSLPQRFNQKKLCFKKLDRGSRRKCYIFSEIVSNEFESFVSSKIAHFIPLIYLEGFLDARKKSLKSHARSPKIILSANGLETDDLFKIYTAEKRKSGSLFVYMQHGGHYGTGKFSSFERLEHKLSDAWLSWGWSSENKNIYPSFKQTLIKKNIPYNSNGDLLILGLSLPRYSYWISSFAIAGQCISNFLDNVEMINSLDDYIISRVSYRLPKDYGFDFKQRLNDIFKEVKIGPFLGLSYKKQVQQSSLVLCTYNATTFIDLFTLNHPTIILWNPEHWELNEIAKPFFQKLVDAEILFFDPKLCANKINEVFKDPISWWLRDEVQHAKSSFCEVYAKESDNISRDLSKILKEISKSHSSLVKRV